jgi:anti-anti-sigma regulatory factor
LHVTPVEPTEPTALMQVDWIDDPAGYVRLITVTGELNSTTTGAAAVQIIELANSAALHIDFNAAEINGGAAMGRLEAMADLLEDLGVEVRIVGVDPLHPALLTV